MFVFLVRQLREFYIGRENLDTKLQVLLLPKTFRVDNDPLMFTTCAIFKAANLMIVHYVPAHWTQS